jgi:acetoin utilization deacetylase AcuC-like enzyme
MRTIHSEQHRLRNAKTELYGGTLVEPFERPSRADMVINAIRESGLGDIHEPEEFPLDPVLAVHDADFVAFLESAWKATDKLTSLGGTYLAAGLKLPPYAILKTHLS